jgi:pimeloyl-ACP methyl ester carboxylesterase
MVDCEGTCHDRAVIGGQANIEGHALHAPAARLRLLRWYDSKTGEWASWWLDGRSLGDEVDDGLPSVWIGHRDKVSVQFNRDMPHPITIRVRDVSIAATVAGKPSRPALLLLHGWPQSSALYDAVLEPLSEDYFVFAPDLPEIGSSRGSPVSGDKTVLSDTMLAAAEQAGAREIVIAGLDVGGMIAFAAAREHAARITGAIVMNTVIPGIEPWSQVLADPRIWHFAFHATPNLPEILVRGHERAYFDFFTDFLSGDPKRIPDTLRERFAGAYARPEALKAGFDWYRAMPGDATRNAGPARIDTPLLYVRGDADKRPIGPYVEGLKRAGAKRLDSRVVPDSGELLPIEAPEAFINLLREFARA